MTYITVVAPAANLEPQQPHQRVQLAALSVGHIAIKHLELMLQALSNLVTATGSTAEAAPQIFQ